MTEHHFGGPWTELKLDAVCYYLQCYTKALSQRNFDLWYVDVFAGTGDRTNEKLAGVRSGVMEKIIPFDAKLEPVGSCIYCGATIVPLSDEHIIPFSLGGRMVLREASCRDCAAITSKFEQECARSMFGSARVSLGLPTRRKKERPTHFPLYKAGDNGELTPVLEVPIDEYPSSLMMMKFSTPRIILGHPDDGVSTMTNEIWTTSQEHNIEEKYGSGLRYKMRFNPLIFSRLLAKIAHSFTVASLEPGTFKPLLVDLILGKHERQGHLVGGSPAKITPDDDRTLHELEGRVVCNNRYLAISIHLFAPLGAPLYYAIAAEL